MSTTMIINRNGVTKQVPATTKFDAVLNPQQKAAERNGNGRLMRETLDDKWSLQCEWEFGTPEEFYAWFKYLATLTRLDFGCTFPAPTGEDVTTEFYISPISASMINHSRGATGWWKTLKCSFVEV